MVIVGSAGGDFVPVLEGFEVLEAGQLGGEVQHVAETTDDGARCATCGARAVSDTQLPHHPHRTVPRCLAVTPRGCFPW